MGSKLIHFTDSGEIFKDLDLMKGFGGELKKAVLFLYDNRKPFLELLNTIKPIEFKDSKVNKVYENDDLILVDLNLIKEGIKKDVKTKVFVLIYKKEPFAVLVTNSHRDYFFQILSFFNKFYPFVSRIFYRSYEIRALLEKVEKENAINFVVQSYVLKRYYVKKKIDVAWESIDYHELYDRAAQSFLWVDALLLDVKMRSDEKYFGTVRINRKGVIQYRSMDFSSINSLFLSKILQKYSDFYHTILINRGRTISNPEPKPILFVMDEEVFKSPEDTEQLIKIIHKSLKNWGYSILSRNGISAFLILHDYTSGSSYELIITSASEVVLIPQTQVTTLSFNQLINVLMDNYDGVIQDA